MPLDCDRGIGIGGAWDRVVLCAASLPTGRSEARTRLSERSGLDRARECRCGSASDRGIERDKVYGRISALPYWFLVYFKFDLLGKKKILELQWSSGLDETWRYAVSNELPHLYHFTSFCLYLLVSTNGDDDATASIEQYPPPPPLSLLFFIIVNIFLLMHSFIIFFLFLVIVSLLSRVKLRHLHRKATRFVCLFVLMFLLNGC